MFFFLMYSGNMELINDSFKYGLISHTVVTVKAAREAQKN